MIRNYQSYYCFNGDIEQVRLRQNSVLWLIKKISMKINFEQPCNFAVVSASSNHRIKFRKTENVSRPLLSLGKFDMIYPFQ